MSKIYKKKNMFVNYVFDSVLSPRLASVVQQPDVEINGLPLTIAID